MQPGHTPDEAVKALMAELERLKAEPITEHELQRAKNQFARDYILGRESNQQKALQLAHAVVIHTTSRRRTASSRSSRTSRRRTSSGSRRPISRRRTGS